MDRYRFFDPFTALPVNSGWCLMFYRILIIFIRHDIEINISVNLHPYQAKETIIDRGCPFLAPRIQNKEKIYFMLRRIIQSPMWFCKSEKKNIYEKKAE